MSCSLWKPRIRTSNIRTHCCCWTTARSLVMNITRFIGLGRENFLVRHMYVLHDVSVSSYGHAA